MLICESLSRDLSRVCTKVSDRKEVGSLFTSFKHLSGNSISFFSILEVCF